MSSISPQRKPSLQNIAIACHTTCATVSRVLNGVTKGFSVNDELREKILDTAKRINYRPNIAARNLISKKTKIVSVFGLINEGVLGSPAAVTTKILSSAMSFLTRYGYEIIISRASLNDISASSEFSWQIDGALVFQSIDSDDLKVVDRLNVPYAVINGVATPQHHLVNPDESSGMEKAILHLYQLGHRCIAYCHPPVDWKHFSILARYHAYLECVKHYKLKTVDGCDQFFPSAEMWVQQVLLPSKATALICYNHSRSLPLLKAIKDAGLKVPRDLSFISYDDTYACAYVEPAMTVISLPLQELGELGAKLLLRSIEQDEISPQNVFLPETLILRNSTDSAPN